MTVTRKEKVSFKIEAGKSEKYNQENVRTYLDEIIDGLCAFLILRLQRKQVLMTCLFNAGDYIGNGLFAGHHFCPFSF